MTGSCHAQTCPSVANDTTKTVAHALQLVKVYSILQVPKERLCIKIPSTTAGFKACAHLEKQNGVRTLATTCFSAEQGMAAAWAGCQYVAPYVNPLGACFYARSDCYCAFVDKSRDLAPQSPPLSPTSESNTLTLSTRLVSKSLAAFSVCTAEPRLTLRSWLPGGLSIYFTRGI